MKCHLSFRRFCILILAFQSLALLSAKAQVYYSTLNIQWNGQTDSSDDVLVTNQINGNVMCFYNIAANGVSGENCDAAIFAYQYTGPGTPDGDWDEIFNEEVIENNPGQENSESGVGSFAVISNQVYQLEADVQNSGSASASFFIPTGVLGALPAPWQQCDVGEVAIPGSAGCDTNNNWTIQSSGFGITNQADSLHFVYQTLTGDGEIIAQVTGLQYTSAFAEAGLMVRETLEANSSYALMAFTASGLDAFGWRAGTGQSSMQTNLPDSAVWLKLVRSGNTLTGYCSTNGVTWVESGSIPITMQTTVLIGLASTADNNTTLNTATFDQVQFEPTLAFTYSGNSLQFNWPTNFILQSTTNLSVSNAWTDFPGTPTVSNSQDVITINTTNGMQFFRLIMQ